MLKSLAILAVFLTVIQASVPVSGQTANGRAAKGEEQRDGTNGNKNPTNPTMTSAKADDAPPLQPNPDKCSPNNQNPAINITNPAPMTGEWNWHDKVSWVISILLAVGAGIGIYFAWATVQATKDAANAARNAASAALKQAEIAANSTRAWITAKPEDRTTEPAVSRKEVGGERLNTVRIGFKNIGQTPAKLIEAGLRYELYAGSSNNLPEPDYGVLHQYHGVMLAPQEERAEIGFQCSLRPSPILWAEDIIKLRGHESFVYAYGIVIYEDIQGNRRETRFGLRFHYATNIYPQAGFVPDGPEAYNRIT